jgi:hypothetical protein
MARKPRKPRKPSYKLPKYRQVSKVRHAGKFLYSFDVLLSDGRHLNIQIVHRNDDKGALEMAKRQFESYAYGYAYGYGY